MLLTHNQYFFVVAIFWVLSLIFGWKWGAMANLVVFFWCGNFMFVKIKEWSE